MTWFLNVCSGSADFILYASEVVIPSTTAQGQAVCVAAIAIFGDTIVEGNERFQLMIQPTNSLDMVSPGGNTTTVTIVDDDGKYTSTGTAVSPTWITVHLQPTGATVSLNETSIVVQEGDDGNTTVYICVVLENDMGGLQRDIMVDFTDLPANSKSTAWFC